MNEVFWGDECRRSANYDSGAVGVIVNGKRLRSDTYEVAKRIAAAGSDGEAAGTANLTEIHDLREAGIDVRTDSVGSRWWVDEVPNPSAYLVKVPKESSGPGKLCGPLGGGLEPAGPGYRGDLNAAPTPWK